MRLNRRQMAWALLGTSLTVLILPTLLRRAGASAAWRAASCMPDHCFCERIRDGVMRQPANTWSSLAFVAAGFWILGSDGADRPEPPSLRPEHRILPGIAVVLIGVGSAFYHATLSFAGQFADVFGMYLLATFVVLHGWSRLRGRDSSIVLPYVVSNAGLAALLYAVPSVRRYVFGLLIAVGAALEIRLRTLRRAGDARFLVYALAVLAAGFAVWVMDITRVACHPSGLIQGHAVWHLAGAAASLLLFRYYVSESAAEGG